MFQVPLSGAIHPTCPGGTGFPHRRSTTTNPPSHYRIRCAFLWAIISGLGVCALIWITRWLTFANGDLSSSFIPLRKQFHSWAIFFQTLFTSPCGRFFSNTVFFQENQPPKQIPSVSGLRNNSGPPLSFASSPCRLAFGFPFCL